MRILTLTAAAPEKCILVVIVVILIINVIYIPLAGQTFDYSESSVHEALSVCVREL